MKVTGGKLDTDDIAEIIRQKENFKTFRLNLKLAAFNLVDSAGVAEKRFRKNEVLRVKNQKKIKRQNEINQRRIDRARRKGSALYTQKIVKLKDTINPKLFLREWFKYRFGEKPVVFDSVPFNKTIEQLSIYLQNRGFYYGNVKGAVEYRNNRKVKVRYDLNTGPQYIIDTVIVSGNDQLIKSNYSKFLTKEEHTSLVGLPFDKDQLNDYRGRVAKYMRDNAVYGFSSSHVNFVADTNECKDMKMKLEIVFSERLVRSDQNRDSLVPVKHAEFKVRDVYFHISDTAYFEGNFKKTVEEMGLTMLDGQFIRTIDTFYYAKITKSRSDELDPHREATFLYNGLLSIDPEVIEIQNYLEHENWYKDYYLERSYTRLLQLGLFQVIKPVLVEIPGKKMIDVHYYLVPAKRQNYSFEPRTTTSNGFLGVSASVNYTNKNLFGGAEKLTFSVGGGFESQPPVFTTLDGKKVKTAGRSFNTFEIGPSVKLDLPGLFPTKVTALSKRQRPRTVISAAYNYQARSEFTRHIFQLNYLWKFYVSKTQIFQIGLPGLSTIKYVNVRPSNDFQSKIEALNDLFLRNSYSNQFIWQDLKLTFEYNNKDKDNKTSRSLFYMNSAFDLAGNTLNIFKGSQDTIVGGQYSIFGVGYSEFARLDNEMIYSLPLPYKTSLHARVQVGAGVPYGNTVTSLPYDYGFFGGGANDNRGWRSRSLGPGAYKYYLDSNRTVTQIGDMRLGGSVEFRFSMGDMFKGALFMDAGNIWTFKEDVNRPGSQFSGNWYREIALSAGAGLRLDLDFFILRFDFGWPLTEPSMPKGEKWIFNKKRTQYNQEIASYYLVGHQAVIPKPFSFVYHFGIGFPF
ncbi:MAG: BamA/TamA family outer membrane protein [Flavobacteriia bacterium]